MCNHPECRSARDSHESRGMQIMQLAGIALLFSLRVDPITGAYIATLRTAEGLDDKDTIASLRLLADQMEAGKTPTDGTPQVYPLGPLADSSSTFVETLNAALRNPGNN